MTANQIAYWNMQESKRSNQARERETNRSNLAQEGLERSKQRETNRANLANEMFNQAKLIETNRSNIANEGINRAKNDLGLMNLREDARHNVAVEAETKRSNVARETETNRANTATENLKTNELIYLIDKAMMEEKGRNTRHAGDLAMKGLQIVGNGLTSLAKIPGTGGSIMDYVGADLHVTNAT